MKVDTKPNPCFYPNPVVLVSVKHDSKESIITLAWVGTICSDPPMVSLSVRPNRFSYQLLKESGECVINFPTASMIEQVQLCGTKSGEIIDKWKECSFTRVKSKIVNTPAIAECPANMECKINQVISLGTHDLFIARVEALHLDDDWKNNEYPSMITYTRGKYGVVEKI